MGARLLSSSKNPQLRLALALQKSGARRRKEALFGVEGFRECTMAVEAGFKVHSLFYSPSLMSREEKDLQKKLEEREQDLQGWEVTPERFQELLVRKEASGLYLLCRGSLPPLPSGLDKDPGIWVVAAGLEKPGNLGALIRSADAAGAQGLILSEARVDPFHPQCIRNSLGSLFHLKLYRASPQEIWEKLGRGKLPLYAAGYCPPQSIPYTEGDFSQGGVLILGSEAQGLSPLWKSFPIPWLHLPLLGQVDSLNVACAGTALLYEAQRQLLSKGARE